MKISFPFCLFILSASVFAFAGEKTKSEKAAETLKAREAFGRYMEMAHPTPDIQYTKPKLMVPLAKAANEPGLFLNVNTIDDEKQYSEKMQNESSIAVNPKAPNVLISSAVDYRNKSATFVAVSSDGGKSWVNKMLGHPFTNWRSSNDPSVTFDMDGVGYLVYGGHGASQDSLSMSFGENAVLLSKTTDNGATWKTHIPVILHAGHMTLDSAFEDKYYIQCDLSATSPYKNHLYIPWKRVTPRDSATQIVISKSTDKGETWSEPIPISPRLSGSSEDTTYGQSFPLSCTGPNGEVYAVWNNGIAHGVGFAKSLDGGETWTAPGIIQTYNIFGVTRKLAGQGWRHSVKQKVRCETYPTIVCDITNSPRRGTLYLTWAAENIPNIYFAKSTDGGDTWSSPKIIHSDTTNDQFWQWSAVDPTNGDLAVMYFDSRRDPENMLVECYISYSSDGGETWVDRRAADFGSDLRKNPFTGNSFAGDYSGCAFYDGIVYPSWIDMRSAELNINDSDVYTAIVNTKAPNAVTDFDATIFPEDRTKVKLTWKNPTTKSFGQPLDASEYKLRVTKDNQIWVVLPGGTTECTDIEATPYEANVYSIYAIAYGDSSMERVATAYPGGARQPGLAKLNSVTGVTENKVAINLTLPATRADQTTALVNMKKLYLYLDSVKTAEYDVNITDTNKTITIEHTNTRLGWYNYSLAVVDEFGNLGEQTTQKHAFSALPVEIPAFTDNVEQVLPNKYWTIGKWVATQQIAHSGTYCFSQSLNPNYGNSQRDTMLIFPVKTNNQDAVLRFYQIAHIDAADKANIYFSTDNGATWSNEFGAKTATYNKTMYSFWQDTELNADDWKLEELQLPKTNETILVKFCFYSNIAKVDYGWFIDDMEITTGTVGVNEDGVSMAMSVYPNPAKDALKVFAPKLSGQVIDMTITTVPGQIAIQKRDIMQGEELALDVSTLPTGVYVLLLKASNGITFRRNFVVSR